MRWLSARRRTAIAVCAAAFLIAGTGPVRAIEGDDEAHHGRHEIAGEESHELMEALEAYNGPRLSPSAQVQSGAYRAAWQHVQNMPVDSEKFTEVTSKPYYSDALHYRDHQSSNSGGGAGHSAGRMAALAVDPAHQGVVYAGGANGGVFRSTDDGGTWKPIADHLPALSVGALAIDSDGALWLATGEATTASDNYLGSGVYRLADPLHDTFTDSDRVGGDELDSTSIHVLRFDSEAGYAFAATSHGVFRRALDAAQSTSWTKVLAPCDGTGVGGIGCGVDSHYADIANDIAVQPGTNGRKLVANVAWRSGAAYNGFYYSSDAGSTWHRANPTGGINPDDIGNASFAYAADGSKLYVSMESPKLLNKMWAGGVYSVLAGVYVSRNGSIDGPYTQIATPAKLASSGSAMKVSVIGAGYQPGAQAWYDQVIAVDPADPDHVYLGLEEVFETRDGGSDWKAVGRYWNFGLDFFSYEPEANTCDGDVMHPDQHALAFSDWKGGSPEVYVGNDGGVYARPVGQTGAGWRNLNKSGTLRTLEYYSAGVGSLPDGSGDAVWGGLQDNGVSLLAPKGSTYTYTYPGTTTPVVEQLSPDGQMVEPFGGDGGDQLVNPKNGCQTVGEYVYLTLQITNNCGYTADDDGEPSAIEDIAPADPGARFIAPIAADGKDAGYWVAGGRYVWGNSKTWASTSGDDWTQLADTGTGHSITAIASQRDTGGQHVIWAAWCGSCNPGSSFARGMMTNYGGSWHQVKLPADFPNRYIAGVTIDPSDASGKTAYAVVNGFSRRWNEGPGAGYGHVWRTTDGGATWTDVSGAPSAADSFPDAPANRMLISPSGTLVVATDLGVFTSEAGSTGHWKRLGLADATAAGNLPTTAAVYLTPSPDGREVYVATHGRGIWKTAMP
jgi:hypothetical protein